MKKALQYLTHNRIRIRGFSVVTVDEAMRACELAALEEKEDASIAFCEITCGKQCTEKHCEKYQSFIDRISYSRSSAESKHIKKPPFEEQTLF